MPYTIACGDVMPGCPEEFTADTEEELLAVVGPHAAEFHGVSEITPDVLAAVQAAIKRS